jgi:outer membrane protein assembly factor BamD (BamD/ComL family)
MKKIKSISLFLALVLFLGAFLFAQQKEKDRVAYEKARELYEKAREIYEKAKQYVYSKEWEKAIEELNKIIEKYQKSEYLDDSLYSL